MARYLVSNYDCLLVCRICINLYIVGVLVNFFIITIFSFATLTACNLDNDNMHKLEVHNNWNLLLIV